MGVIKCNVFKVEYREDNHNNFDYSVLVLADSIEEALDVFKEKYPKYSIRGVHTYSPIIRRTTKTITIDI